MEPLIALLSTTLLIYAIGRLAVPSWRSWILALRVGVSAMFVLTGVAHFIGMRNELINMVPPGLPAPELLVTVTGILELAGAGALFWRPLRNWAAGGLTLMLVVMFPANVYWSMSETSLTWSETLIPRTILQAVFIAATVTVLVWNARSMPHNASAQTKAAESAGAVDLPHDLRQ